MSIIGGIVGPNRRQQARIMRIIGSLLDPNPIQQARIMSGTRFSTRKRSEAPLSNTPKRTRIPPRQNPRQVGSSPKTRAENARLERGPSPHH